MGHERSSIYADGVLIGSVVRNRFVVGDSVWEGSIRQQPIRIKHVQSGSIPRICAEVQLAEIQLRFTFSPVNSKVNLQLNGASLSVRAHGGGYGVVREGQDLAWYEPVWKDSDQEAGILSRAHSTQSTNQSEVDALAVFLLFVYRFERTILA